MEADTGRGTLRVGQQYRAGGEDRPDIRGDVLRPTLLAPELVEAILDDRQPVEMTLPVLIKPFPMGGRCRSSFSPIEQYPYLPIKHTHPDEPTPIEHLVT